MNLRYSNVTPSSFPHEKYVAWSRWFVEPEVTQC